jgi:VanZ family protein
MTIRSKWIPVCIVTAALGLLVLLSLSGEAAQPRTVLGWETEHFLGYFLVALTVCFAWPRPLLVAAGLIVMAFLLEGLQAFTPDRTPNLLAALFGAGGTVVAALLAELFIRARGRHPRESD